MQPPIFKTPAEVLMVARWRDNGLTWRVISLRLSAHQSRRPPYGPAAMRRAYVTATDPSKINT